VIDDFVMNEELGKGWKCVVIDESAAASMVQE
jgi:hypothetical protein